MIQKKDSFHFDSIFLWNILFIYLFRLNYAPQNVSFYFDVRVLTSISRIRCWRHLEMHELLETIIRGLSSSFPLNVYNTI